MALTVRTFFFALVSIIGFLVTFATMYDLVTFLSNQNLENNRKCWAARFLGCTGSSQTVSVMRGLLNDAFLLVLFMLQHSCMAMSATKDILEVLNLGVIERSVYIIATSAVLQVMMCYWKHILSIQLWSITDALWCWVFFFAHVYAWAVVYMGSITMDITELLGIKQVYYALNGLPSPLSFKSKKLQRLYKHMRHPSFLGFFIILTAYPEMTLDRVLLLLVWISYMTVMWKNDKMDHSYQKEQLDRKRITLAMANHYLKYVS